MGNEYAKLSGGGLEIALFGADETVALGRDLGLALTRLEPAERVRCILFFGELGYGKTTLTRGLVSSLPGGEDAEVSSPSFTLCNVYPTTPAVVHCDFYRSEFGSLPDEVAEALDDGEELVLVEWAERIAPDDLPSKRLDVRFRLGEHSRIVTLEPRDETARSLLREMVRLRGSAV